MKLYNDCIFDAIVKYCNSDLEGTVMYLLKSAMVSADLKENENCEANHGLSNCTLVTPFGLYVGFFGLGLLFIIGLIGGAVFVYQKCKKEDISSRLKPQHFEMS